MKTSTTQVKSLGNTISYLAVAFIWLLVWELLSMAINEEILFISPLKAFVTLFSMMGTASYWSTILCSVFRVIGGFIIGYIVASCLAVLSFKFGFFKLFISPAISVIKATPVASFIILALMWSGKDFVPVLICILMVTPIVWSNVLEGLRSVDADLIEMCDVYKMSSIEKARHVYLPSLIPYNAAAVGSGLGLCWKAGVAAEVICRTMPSIGNSIWETKFYIITDELFAWTATVVLLSVFFDFIVKKITAKLLSGYKTEVAADD